MKRSIPGPWRITRDGLVGDWQGDTRHHGGPEKALHHYPHEHYASWIMDEPCLNAPLALPPAFGENFSTTGITEETVCIGDVYRAGVVLFQVSQGRQPCWRLNARFGRADMALRVQNTGRTGWYYRVLCEGKIEPGSEFVLVDRPRPEWPLARVISLLICERSTYTRWPCSRSCRNSPIPGGNSRRDALQRTPSRNGTEGFSVNSHIDVGRLNSISIVDDAVLPFFRDVCWYHDTSRVRGIRLASHIQLGQRRLATKTTRAFREHHLSESGGAKTYHGSGGIIPLRAV